MYKLYFKSEFGWVGDCMPCYHDGWFYLYFQNDTRIPAPYPNGTPFGWSLAKSRDLVHFEEFGEVLEKGSPDTIEQYIYAGSVIYANGCFRAFYTGHCDGFVGTGRPAEVLMFATSRDGISFEKHPELTIVPPEGYEKDFFRDPFVYYDEDVQKWIMLVPARHSEGPCIRRGSMTYFISDDLEHWDFKGDLWYPGMSHLLQMPDMFKIGDWWYLFYSERDDERKTRYRMSKSIYGPWLAPGDDCLDGRCYYAARTIEVDERRYLFGWNPTRENGSDLDMWVWGGAAVTQEIYQRKDGTLAVKLPEIHDKLFLESEAQSLSESAGLSRADGWDELVLTQNSGTFFRLDMKVRFTEGTFAFGVKMYENSERDCGYTYIFSPPKQDVTFDKIPNYKWFLCMNKGLTRPVRLVPGKEYAVTLIVDDDISVLYVDGVALNARMCEKPGREIKLFVHGGSISVSGIRFFDALDK